MKKHLFFILCFSSLTALSISCSKGSGGSGGGGTGGGGGGGGTGGGSTCTGTPGPKFTAVRNILQSNCAIAGCHSGSTPQNGINFTDNCTIVAQSSRIKFRAVDRAGTAEQMPPPPAAPLSAADRQAINDWVAAGGKLTD